MSTAGGQQAELVVGRGGRRASDFPRQVHGAAEELFAPPLDNDLAVFLHELKLPKRHKDKGALRGPPPTEADWRFAWRHYDNQQEEAMTFIGCGYDDVVGKLLPRLGGSSLIDFISFVRDARGSFASRLDPDYYRHRTLGGDVTRRRDLRRTQFACVDKEMPARPQRLKEWTSFYQRITGASWRVGDSVGEGAAVAQSYLGRSRTSRKIIS